MNNYRENFEKEREQLLTNYKETINLIENMNKEFNGLINLEEQIDQLQNSKQNLENKDFEIVVVGEFSTGKSTFINALMGKNILPSKVTSTTATINFLKHSERNNDIEEAVVYMKNGETHRITHDEVFDYTTEMSKTMNVSEEVKHIDIFIASNYLKNGVVIVDTPGLAALNEEHIKITYDKITNSQASIMLFNSEQAGRDTEFQFLQRLKGYIDRIFFVVNRIDVTPSSELPAVLDGLKQNLAHNKYVEIPKEKIELFPVSAMQALKVNEPTLDVSHTWWKDLDNDELKKQSKFFEFENRLEEYLFNGEQSEDSISSPKYALLNLYTLLIDKLNILGDDIENDNIEELKEEYENLKQLVELKKKELEKNVIKFSNEIDELKEEIIEETKKHIEESSNSFLERLEEAESTYELQETISDDLEFYTNDINKIYSDQIKNLQRKVDKKLRNNYQKIKFKLQEQNIDDNLTAEQINIQIKQRERNLNNYNLFDEEEYNRQKEALSSAREQLKLIRQLEQDYQEARDELENIESAHERENKYFESLYSNISSTKTERKKRIILKFLREREYEVENPEYKRILEEQRERIFEQNQEKDESSLKARRAKRELNAAKSGMEYDFESMQEITEHEKALNKERRQEHIKAMNLAKEEDKKILKKEKRKIKQTINKQAREYIKNFVENIDDLDSIDLVKQEIEKHIQDENEELQKSNEELIEKEKFLKESQQEKARVKGLIFNYQNTIQEKRVEMM